LWGGGTDPWRGSVGGSYWCLVVAAIANIRWHRLGSGWQQVQHGREVKRRRVLLLFFFLVNDWE